MSTNLTEEIRSVEAAAAQKVADARAQAQDLVAQTRAAAAARVKEAKQSQFRDYRKRLGEVEAEAEKASALTVEQGKAGAEEFVREHEEAVKKTAQWLAEEVV
ncbi:MAG: cell envelope biogenesis protein TolA, partial [Pyramidobacter sp.]|nr:cell envelope biogenesis protein TolA [Pyramidobacter sp.]